MIPPISVAKRGAAAPLVPTEGFESHVAGLAMYRHQMALHGVEADASIAANKAVRDTQGANSAVFIPQNFRMSGTPQSALYGLLNGMFMSFHNTATGALWTAVREGGQAVKGGEDAGAHAWKGLNKAISYWLVPAMLSVMVTTYILGRRDKEKGKPLSAEETALHEMGWGLAEGPLGGMGGLNFITSAAHYDSGFGGPVGEVSKEVKAVARENGNGKVRQALMAFGTLTGTTSRGEGDLLQALWDAQPGTHLDPDEQNAAAFGQRAFLGRAPIYSPNRSRSRGHSR